MPHSPLRPNPAGALRSISERSFASESGRCSARNVVSTAIIPQPMSTPTAAGIIAPLVGITEPTVAPRPKWTSGMTARWECTNGNPATFSSCSRALSSTGTPFTQALMRPPAAVSNTSNVLMSAFPCSQTLRAFPVFVIAPPPSGVRATKNPPADARRVRFRSAMLIPGPYPSMQTQPTGASQSVVAI